jgi:hypothetical protein
VGCITRACSCNFLFNCWVYLLWSCECVSVCFIQAERGPKFYLWLREGGSKPLLGPGDATYPLLALAVVEWLCACSYAKTIMKREGNWHSRVFVVSYFILLHISTRCSNLECLEGSVWIFKVFMCVQEKIGIHMWQAACRWAFAELSQHKIEHRLYAKKEMKSKLELTLPRTFTYAASRHSRVVCTGVPAFWYIVN